MPNTIKLKRSSSAGSAPIAGNLSDGEIALNTADKILYFKDSSGNVKQVKDDEQVQADATALAIALG